MTTATKDVSEVMTTRAHIESMIAAFNKHDVDQVMKFFSADVMWEDPSRPEPAVGLTEAREMVRAMLKAFPDLHFDPKHLDVFVAPDGKTAMSSWVWTGTMLGRMDPPGYPATGKRVKLRGTCWYRMKGGLISRHVVTYDVMGLLQQLGLMPGSESFGARAMVGAQRLSHGLTHRAKEALHL